MNKKTYLTISILLLLSLAHLSFSQTLTPTPSPVATPATQYYINVSTPMPPVPGMPLRPHTIRYSGAFTGEAVEPFVIGPSTSPFTVQIEHVTPNEEYTIYFAEWVIDGVIQPFKQTVITVSVNDATPVSEVYAMWAESPPTMPPEGTATPVPGVTPCCEIGTVWTEPASLSYMLREGTCQATVNPNKFETKVFMDTKSRVLAAYGIDLSWDPLVMDIDGSIGTNGVEPGASGFVSTASVVSQGRLKIEGLEPAGVGPGSALHLLTIHWLGVMPGTTEIGITVNFVVDPETNNINLNAVKSLVTVTPSLVGDVNGTGSIDIIDALLVAQYYVGLSIANFNTCFADANRSGSIDIIDALLIARCYVGLVSCAF